MGYYPVANEALYVQAIAWGQLFFYLPLIILGTPYNFVTGYVGLVNSWTFDLVYYFAMMLKSSVVSYITFLPIYILSLI